MDKERLSPELEQFIRKVRLKEPPEGLMANYLAGVNDKIDRGAPGSHFGFPQAAMVLAIGLVLAGAVYFYWIRPQTQSTSDIETITSTVSETSVQQKNETNVSTDAKTLSIEEEMAVLEAFSEELDEEGIDLLGDEEVFEELGQLDEIELSPGLSASRSGV